MEREQATLPFVVPSHLSKLFGLKASVIVEGEGDESGGGAPLANSTCWGDGETAVVRRWGYKEKYRSTLLSFFLHLSFLPFLPFLRDKLSFHLPSTHPTFNPTAWSLRAVPTSNRKGTSATQKAKTQFAD